MCEQTEPAGETTVWVNDHFESLFKQTKNPARPQSYGVFMELLSRFELLTSSLPMVPGL